MGKLISVSVSVAASPSVIPDHVCVCVCVNGRERERWGDIERRLIIHTPPAANRVCELAETPAALST